MKQARRGKLRWAGCRLFECLTSSSSPVKLVVLAASYLLDRGACEGGYPLAIPARQTFIWWRSRCSARPRPMLPCSTTVPFDWTAALSLSAQGTSRKTAVSPCLARPHTARPIFAPYRGDFSFQHGRVRGIDFFWLFTINFRDEHVHVETGSPFGPVFSVA